MNVDSLRQDFPILSRQASGHPLIYLDNAATSQKPRVVIDAITDYYTHHNANIHRGIHTLGDESTRLYEESRRQIASFIGAKDPNELIFVRNTTEAINLVAFTWGLTHLQAGDEVITTELEHHSNLVTWQRVCQQVGAKLVFIPIDGNGDLALDLLESLIGPQTKLVAITHVSNTLGTIVDIYHLVKSLKRYGAKAKIMLDAAQSLPHLPVNVSELDVDFLAFSGHKMLGPMGIGGLWMKLHIIKSLDPFLVGGGMIKSVTKESSTWADLPDRFDAGTPNVAGAVGLAAAVKYLQKLGMSAVRDHEKDLLSYALKLAKPLENQGIIEVYGLKDPEKRAGILTFNVSGVHAHDTAQVLDREFGIAVRSGHHCNQILNDKLGVPATVRASFYLYNTTAEIDTLFEGINHVYQMFNQ
jgi:cysteine desulfurase / selenocysteine lyase